MIDRHPHPGFVLPSNDWYSSTELPRVSSGLRTLLVGILLGSIVSSRMIALGAWLF